MTTRSEREKAQKLNEQHQAILSKMLREEDNKYCADCEAKGTEVESPGFVRSEFLHPSLLETFSLSVPCVSMLTG